MNDKFDDVKKRKGNSQRNPPSVKTMEQMEAEMVNYWARQKYAEEIEAEAKIRAAAKMNAQYDEYEQQHYYE